MINTQEIKKMKTALLHSDEFYPNYENCFSIYNRVPFYIHFYIETGQLTAGLAARKRSPTLSMRRESGPWHTYSGPSTSTWNFDWFVLGLIQSDLCN